MDRNIFVGKAPYMENASLSARRAWIEIRYVCVICRVAFLSLSARRAWIEIYYTTSMILYPNVALRKESVDRNAQNPARDIHRPPSLSARRAWIEILAIILKSMSVMGRSPQGERG